jgi:secondary thiamine-phosphate synthase enzyme
MIVTRKLSIPGQGTGEILDITSQVEQQIAESGVRNGIVTIFVASTTAAVTVMENEAGLIADFKAFWERIVPCHMDYEHHKAWGEFNGFAHIRTSLLGVSVVIPFAEKKLTLGTWQQVLLLDFDDKPKTRQVVVQIMGE